MRYRTCHYFPQHIVIDVFLLSSNWCVLFDFKPRSYTHFNTQPTLCTTVQPARQSDIWHYTLYHHSPRMTVQRITLLWNRKADISFWWHRIREESHCNADSQVIINRHLSISIARHYGQLWRMKCEMGALNSHGLLWADTNDFWSLAIRTKVIVETNRRSDYIARLSIFIHETLASLTSMTSSNSPIQREKERTSE